MMLMLLHIQDADSCQRFSADMRMMLPQRRCYALYADAAADVATSAAMRLMSALLLLRAASASVYALRCLRYADTRKSADDDAMRRYSALMPPMPARRCLIAQRAAL